MQIFWFEVKSAAILNAARFMNMRGDELRARRNAAQTGLRFTNIVESDDGTISIVILSGAE